MDSPFGSDDEYRVEILPEDYAQYDLNFKIIVIGDSGVGKSCLTTKAVKNNFEEYYTATVGFEFLTFNLKLNDNVIKLQIWDTCGQEIYKSLISNFYRNSALAIMLYSIDNKDSFVHTENWLNEVKNLANPDIRIFLVGNKSDLEGNRVISKEEGENFKEKNKLDLFIETSAKTGYNARNVLVEAAKCLFIDYNNFKKNNANTEKNRKNSENSNTKLDNKNDNVLVKSKKCCGN